MLFLLLRFLLRNLLLFCLVYLLHYLFFLSYSLQYSFSILCACFFFNDNMPWRCSILVKSVWCPEGFLYPNQQNFLKIWEIFCYYFIACIMDPFCLYFFSFFNAHESQVWSSDGVTEFLHIPFSALGLFD
jgi:hypothetical protein